mgnify:CR=1 FL=1
MNLEIYSANKKKETLLETPAVVNVITSDDIKLLNFNTLEQVLEYSTGIASLNGEGNIFTTSTIRGNTLINYNTNTLLLYDGIPLYNAYHGSFDFQAIPLSSIDRVEIIKGSNSVLYGSNAVNGVINIISKKTKVGKANQIEGRIKYGTYNTLYSNTSLIANKDDWEFSIFSDLLTTDGETLPYKDEKGNILELEKAYKGACIATKVAYKDLHLNFKYYTRSLPGVRTREFKPVYTSPGDSVGIIHPELSDESSYLVNLEYDKDFSEKLVLNVRSNIVDWRLRKELFDGYWDYTSFGIYNDLSLNVKSTEKIYNKIGVSFNHYIGRRFKSQDNSYDIGKNNIWTDDVAVFINGEYIILKSLKGFYGARFYYAKYGKTTFNDFSPRFALTYSLNKKLFFKAVYGKSYRIPTYFEKEVASASVVGNPNLYPEKSTSYDFIISGSYKGVQFDIDMFYSEIINRILRVPSPDDITMFTNLNIGKIALYGGEFNSKFKMKEKVYGFLGYSYTEGVDLETSKKLEYVFNNMVNFGVNMQFNAWLSGNISAKYMDDWGQAPNYTLLNLGLSLKPNARLPLFIEAKIDNVLNTKIYLPEIARKSELVPTIPKTFSRIFYIGLSFNF